VLQVTVRVPSLLKLVKQFSVRKIRIINSEKYSTPPRNGPNSGAYSTGYVNQIMLTDCSSFRHSFNYALVK
jgi:hypothetical protein